MDDFWDNILFGAGSSLDAHLRDHQEHAQKHGLVRLTDKGRAANALPLPAPAGTRVAFIANLGSVLTYTTPPAPDSEGTVVMVRTAEGDQTGMGDAVFVKFDDGQFMAMHHEHLRRSSPNIKKASNYAFRSAGLGDLSGFLRVSVDLDNELVHRATRDLWSMKRTDEGDFIVARLFDDSGEPLKV